MDLRDQLQSALGDAYTIERELGGGGMSRVFLATERSLGRQVVVKILPSDMAGQVSVERFKREIALAAQLQHPHIVPLLTAGDAGGLPYFTMPFVKGESLRARLAQHGELPVSEAIRTLREVASALAFAHASDIVHRDIKPDNILLSGGAAMVTDFGVAKALGAAASGAAGAITSLGVALGTPAYMSPEQASADPIVDHRADIYAWGVLAYELLTGGTPFAGRPASAMLAAHAAELPEPITKRRAALPAPLAALVMRCLEKRAADRPQSATELVQAIDAITTPSGGLEPTSAQQPSAALATPARSRRAPAMMAIGVLVLAIAAAAWYAVTRRAAPAGARAIAVLPFENASGDSTLDYLAEGMSDEVRSQLTEIPGLSVRARSSSQAFRGRRVDLAEVGAKLGVSEVLQASVRATAVQLHVTAELVRIADGTALWSHTFDGQSASLATVQDSITRAIAGALRLRLRESPADAPGAAGARGTSDAEAYNSFLRGEYYRRRFDGRSAVPYLRQAVDRDPRFARAWASLGHAYAVMPQDGFSSADTAWSEAKRAIDRALELDSTLVAGHVAKGLLAYGQHRYDEADAAYQRALSLDPGNAEAMMGRAGPAVQHGRLDDALALVNRARDADPLSADVLVWRQYLLTSMGRFTESVAQTKAILELDAHSVFALSNQALNFAFLGMRDSTEAYTRRMLAGGTNTFGARLWAMFGFAAAGRWDDVDAQRALIERESGNSPQFTRAVTLIVYGDIDGAVAAAERSLRALEPMNASVYWGCDPTFDPLKSRPRFVALMKEVGSAICPPKPNWPIKPRPK